MSLSATALQKQHQIHNLDSHASRRAFAESLTENTFALISIPDRHQTAFRELFQTFQLLFNSNESLECSVNQQYIGYTATPDVKQSLWFYQNRENKIQCVLGPV